MDKDRLGHIMDKAAEITIVQLQNSVRIENIRSYDGRYVADYLEEIYNRLVQLSERE